MKKKTQIKEKCIFLKEEDWVQQRSGIEITTSLHFFVRNKSPNYAAKFLPILY